MSRADATSFLFQILEGPRSGSFITLSGRSLPYRSGAGGSIAFGGTQRSKLVWYQGNRTATQLIFGPMIDPTTINGTWRDRYLGDEASITLVEAFEELRDSGVQVRVSWSTIERRGIVKTFKWMPGAPVGGLSDIAWEMVLEWAEAAAPPKSQPIGKSKLSVKDGITGVSQGFSALRDDVNGFIDTYDNFVGLRDLIFDTIKISLNQSLTDGDAASASLAANAAKIGDSQNLPASTTKDTASALDAASGSVADLAETTANIFPPVTAKQDDVDLVLLQALDRILIVEDAMTLLGEFLDQRILLESIIAPDAFKVIRPIRGGDLREVAIAFYGNADLWQRIAELNGIEGSLIPDDVDDLVVPTTLPTVLDTASDGLAGTATGV